MVDALWLRFDAPLVSFGATIVDQLGKIQEFPGLSLLTGLLGNALGYDHRDFERLSMLQSRLRYAVRQDRAGVKFTDFQTVDLGQSFLVDTGWTRRGSIEERAGASSTSTHIRYRDYLADSVYTIALTLVPGEGDLNLETLVRAFEEPERPLFIGRKHCLPASPLLLGRTKAPSLLEALAAAPLLEKGRGTGREVQAWWPADEGDPAKSMLLQVVDERDWANQIHSGCRFMRQGRIRIGEETHAV